MRLGNSVCTQPRDVDVLSHADLIDTPADPVGRGRRTLDRVFRWSLSLSIAAACLLAISLAISGVKAGMEWGNVGEWAGGVSSSAAAGVALWIGLDGNRRYRKDQAGKTAEARERGARRAKQVHLDAPSHVGGDTFQGRKPSSYLATIKNAMASPIYDLQWYPPVVVVSARVPSPAANLLRDNGNGSGLRGESFGG